MSKMTHTLLSAAVAMSALMLVSNVHAEAAKNETTNAAAKPPATDGVIHMKTYLCKDVMRMNGEERDITLGFMHGYFLGKKAATEYVVGTLGKASDDFIEYCLDHPNDIALDAMEKFLK